MNIKPIHEYLLWNNCSNHCDFCIQAVQNKLSKEEQIKSIDEVINHLSTLQDSHVLIMGGEIFDINDTDIKSKLTELFIVIYSKMILNNIELLYINTNLLYDITFLCSILNIFNDVIDRIRFTTSDDFDGRFKGQAKKKFYQNLKMVRTLYPDMRIVSNTILTKPFCEAVLKGNYKLSEYMNITGCLVNTIPYFKVVNDVLAPSKELVLKTLKRLDEDVFGFGVEYCRNFLLKQQKILLQYQKGKLIDVSAENAKCGHCVNFQKCFSDSDECFICMLNDLLETGYFE